MGELGLAWGVGWGWGAPCPHPAAPPMYIYIYIRRPLSEGHHGCGDWFQLLISNNRFKGNFLLAVVKSKITDFCLLSAVINCE